MLIETPITFSNRVLRFLSPCLVNNDALSSSEDLVLVPNNRDFAFPTYGFDASLLYGFYGTQSKLWGINHAFHGHKPSHQTFIAVDWDVTVNSSARTLDEWFSDKTRYVSNIELPARSTNELLRGSGETLIIKNLRSTKVTYLSDIWKSAAERIYGLDEFRILSKKTVPDWDSPLSFCSIYPLAVAGVFQAFPGFSCIVFPRTVDGRDLWLGCIQKSNISRLITKISARGYGERVITLL